MELCQGKGMLIVTIVHLTTSIKMENTQKYYECPRPGLEPGPLHPESSLQVIRPSNGPELCNKRETVETCYKLPILFLPRLISRKKL